MAKTSVKSGSAALLDEPRAGFYRPAGDPETDARLPRAERTASDGEDDAGEPFLRARRRVPVRRGVLPAWSRTRWGRIALIAGGLGVVGMGVGMLMATRNFLDHDPRFRIDSSASIQTVGNSQLTRDDLLSVFGSDIGRNLFYVPLSQRRAELERFNWVEHATVMRVLPNQLRVAVTERTPIAFVEVNGRIELADAAGVILNMSPQEIAEKHYSFPVVSGINPEDPLSVRGARMALYQRFLRELDGGGEKVSAQLSEVDLSDPEDVRATVTANGSDLHLQFGQDDFLARWKNYEAHVGQWRAQYPKLAAVDLRYEHEVVLKMTPDAAADGPAESKAAAPKPAATAKKKANVAKVKRVVKAHATHAQVAVKSAGRGAR
ncbi:MAG: FtsQ-type POTRA domain-containing protein [Acidobacteriaceae bacterium]